MKLLKIVIFLLIMYSCESQPKYTWIGEIENDGYTYLGEVRTPHGIYDTLIWGYTDQKNLIYHQTSERFKTLKITGFEFEKSANEPYKKQLMIYQFELGDDAEKSAFEAFQKYALNYQRHHKNGVEFFTKNGNWMLRFEPMP